MPGGELAEAREQQAATAEILRAIRASPAQRNSVEHAWELSCALIGARALCGRPVERPTTIGLPRERAAGSGQPSLQASGCPCRRDLRVEDCAAQPSGVELDVQTRADDADRIRMGAVGVERQILNASRHRWGYLALDAQPVDEARVGFAAVD